MGQSKLLQGVYQTRAQLYWTKIVCWPRNPIEDVFCQRTCECFYSNIYNKMSACACYPFFFDSYSYQRIRVLVVGLQLLTRKISPSNSIPKAKISKLPIVALLRIYSYIPYHNPIISEKWSNPFVLRTLGLKFLLLLLWRIWQFFSRERKQQFI